MVKEGWIRTNSCRYASDDMVNSVMEQQQSRGSCKGCVKRTGEQRRRLR